MNEQKQEGPIVTVKFYLRGNCHDIIINGALCGVIRHNRMAAQPFSLELNGTWFLDGVATRYGSKWTQAKRHFLTLLSAKEAVRTAIHDLYKERGDACNGDSGRIVGPKS